MRAKKLFAGLVAGTMVVGMGVTAFADTNITDNTAGFNSTAGTYSIKTDLSSYGTDQMTILIIPEAAYNKTSIEDSDILYIDQAAANTDSIFKSVGILGGADLTAGTYYVKIGGENITADGIIVEKFTVGSGGTTYTFGDVDNNGTINATDASWILSKYANSSIELPVPDTYADVDGNGTINATDASWVLSKYANSSVVFPVEETD